MLYQISNCKYQIANFSEVYIPKYFGVKIGTFFNFQFEILIVMELRYGMV